MRRATIFLCNLLILAMVPALLLAQTGTIAGKVTSNTGEPLPGANVVVQIQALTLGAAADVNGNYTITNVPAGTQRVTARFIGFRSEIKEIHVNPAKITVANFELSPTVLQLDEVVITGAGAAVEKMKLGNTISTINSSNLQELPINSISDVLQGRVPGVQALPSGGLAGEGTRLRIRGSASLSQTNEPIIYIDGIRVDGGGGFTGVGAGGGGEPSRLDDINPAAIERVEILKGAAAATLYGTQANAGVIQIFTKQGTQSKPNFTFELQHALISYPDAFKANVGFARNLAQANALSQILGRTVTPFQIFEGPRTKDLMETKYFGSGFGQTYSASVSGGQTGITYFGSLRYTDTDGPFNPTAKNFFGESKVGGANDRVQRGQVTANLNIVPSDKLRIRLGTNYTYASLETIENNNNIYSPLTLSEFGKPERIQRKGFPNPNSPSTIATSDNPQGTVAFATVREGLHQETKDRTDHGNVSLSGSYSVTHELMLDATVGLDYVNQRSSNFNPFGWNVDSKVTTNVDGALNIGNRQRQEWTLDAKGIWSTSLTDAVNSQLIVGVQGFRSIENTSGGSGVTFPGPGLEVLGAGSVQTSYSGFSDVINAGVLAQEQLSYYDYLFLTVGVRLDANSAFGSSFKTASYPKGSVSILPLKALNVSVPALSTLRLRTAIGQSGQQPGAFDKLTTFTPFNSPEGSGLAPANLGNQNLKPEVSTEWEVGAETGWLDDRIGLEVTYWDRTVKDALVARAFAPSGGFWRTQLDNIGELKAKGIDVSLNATILRSDDITLSVFANGAYLHEKIASMGGAPPLKAGGSYPRYRNFIREGYAPGAFFGPKLAPFDYPIDTNKDGKPDTYQELLTYFSQTRDPSTWAQSLLMVIGADGSALAGGKTYLEHYLGKPTPDWQGSFGFNLTLLKNFRVSALFEYKTGEFYVHNLTDEFRRSHPVIGRNIQKSAELEAILMNPASTAEQRVAAAQKWAKEMAGLSPYDGLNAIEKADFVRWRELSMTYDIPNEYSAWFGVSNASVTLAGRNIALWTKYSGIDPEVNAIGRRSGGGLDTNFLTGTEAFGIPIPRQFVFTLRFGI